MGRRRGALESRVAVTFLSFIPPSATVSSELDLRKGGERGIYSTIVLGFTDNLDFMKKKFFIVKFH